MPITINRMHAIVYAEYSRLVAHLRLQAIALDVYEVREDGSGHTSLGTDVRNATPGYTPSRIVLPQEPGDLAIRSDLQPAFPPTSWNPYGSEWSIWRTELWHEVVHQYQDQILMQWDPKDGTGGHTLGWQEALAAVGERFGITGTELLAVI